MRCLWLPLVAALAAACVSTKPQPAPEPVPEAAPITGSLPGDRIPEFRATVRRAAGEEGFDSRATKHATVYIVNSTTCPFCAEYAKRMKEDEATYMPKGVDVVHVYPVRTETPEEKIAWHKEQGFRGGQILDGDANIARLLTADRTPTVYLVDQKGVILYRGAIEDGGKAYLADAIDAHLAGKPVAVPSTDPPG